MKEGEVNIDPEIEEQLAELLVELYVKWKSCSHGAGTDEDKKDTFFHVIRGRIEKGFSILKEPGRYGDEKEMEIILGKLYKIWKNYMSDYLDKDSNIDIFINTSREVLDEIIKGGKWHGESGDTDKVS
jgi:hypothetical protein